MKCPNPNLTKPHLPSCCSKEPTCNIRKLASGQWPVARLVPLPPQALESETLEARKGAAAAPECDWNTFPVRVTGHQKEHGLQSIGSDSPQRWPVVLVSGALASPGPARPGGLRDSEEDPVRQEQGASRCGKSRLGQVPASAPFPS